MIYNEARNRATQKYHKEHLEQVNIKVQRGKKEEYKQIAEEQGCSLTALISYMVENTDLFLPFIIGADQCQELKRITEQNGTTIKDLLDKAVNNYIDKHKGSE